MAEIFDEDAEDQLRAVQQTINAAINELHAFRQYRSRAPGASEMAWMAFVRAKGATAGIDLTEWVGNTRPSEV